MRAVFSSFAPRLMQVFYLAQFQTLAYVAIYAAMLAVRYRRVSFGAVL